VSGAQVTYTPQLGTTPQGERAALSNAYAFILDSAKKRGRIPDKSGPDDAMMNQIEGVDHVERRPD
jgi:hypothetical protein